MIVEEAIRIAAPLSRVWDVFMNLTCWADWNTIVTNVSSAEACLMEGAKFKCCIRPYDVPVYFQPRVVKVIPKKKIVWTSRKYGVSSLHEFFFEEAPGGTTIRSVETLSGLPILLGGFLLVKQKIRDLTTSFLIDLKRASEKAV